MSMCEVLAVLEDAEDQLWTTFEAAIDLAAAENARLTLAKTVEAGRSYMWLSPFAFGGAYVPPPITAEADAERLLTRAAELVPAWLPVTTLMLGHDTQDALRRLIRNGRYGAVVAGPKLFRHCPRFARDLRRTDIRCVATGKPPALEFQRVCARLLSDWQPPEPVAHNANSIT